NTSITRYSSIRYCGRLYVRKLKNLQGKESWERHMIARKRKTIAVCRSCHKKIHDGKID
ncbi:hypothetical protein, partial [Paramuribaculum intestinale]|uniref:HNH endonuclease n=1 Tax=Paramuribaculum intestinale TaxID=2094151 RepID=UPI00338D9FAE